MKVIIGTVKALNGQFFAKDSNGDVVELHVGDKITKDMVVFGADGNSADADIKIGMLNLNEAITLTGLDKQTFDMSLIEDNNIDDLLSPDSLKITLNEDVDIQDDKNIDEEDILDGTEAGEEQAVKGQSVNDVFDARDGEEVDVSSSLRNAKFNSSQEIEPAQSDDIFTRVANVVDTAPLIAPEVSDKSLILDSDGNATINLSDYESGGAKDIEDDANAGKITQIQIDTLPTNGILYVNGAAVSQGDIFDETVSFEYEGNYSDSTLFGTKEDTGTFDEWGVYDSSTGNITLDLNGITGIVSAVDGSNDRGIGFKGTDINTHSGVGIGVHNNQISNNETLSINFDSPVANGEIGLSSMGGWFRPGSINGQATWKAYLNGVEVASGEEQQDGSDDGNPNTVVVNVNQPFDSIVFATISDSKSPDFSIQYIEVNSQFDDMFSYSAIDSDGLVSADSATVILAGAATNFVPDASDDSFNTNEDSALVIQAADILSNDIDSNGDALTIISVSNPSNGTVVLNADGTVTFTPNTDYNGPAAFDYTISDGNGAQSSASVSLNINSDGLVAVDDSTIIQNSVAVNTTANDGALVIDSTGANPELLGGANSVDITLNITSTDTSTSTALLSYATDSQNNEFLIYNGANGKLSLYVDGHNVSSSILASEIYDGVEHSLNVTWDSATGEAEFFLDGQAKGTATIAQGHTIGENGTLMFGQEQDSNGGRLDGEQTFSGEYHSISISTDGQEVASWDMNSVENAQVIDSIGSFNLNIVGDANTVVDSIIPISTDESSAVIVDVLANDSDIEGDTLFISEIQGQDVTAGQLINVMEGDNILGTASVVDDKIEFTPSDYTKGLNDSESQDVSFEYSVSDGDASETANVLLNVTGDGDVSYTYDGTTDIDGGAGFDSVAIDSAITFDAGTTLDFTKLDNIEKIDLSTNSNNDSIVNLTLDDVLNITDSSNELIITGDNADDISSVNTDGWTKGVETYDNSAGTTSYEYSKDGSSDSITLIVDDQIDTTGM